MSDALPALGRGVINSVIALFGRPPPLARSKKRKPVVKTEAAGAERAGNRSESAFRRSIMTAGVAMTNYGMKGNMFKRTFIGNPNGNGTLTSVLSLREGEEDAKRQVRVNLSSAARACAPAKPSRLEFLVRARESNSDNAGSPLSDKAGHDRPRIASTLSHHRSGRPRCHRYGRPCSVPKSRCRHPKCALRSSNRPELAARRCRDSWKHSPNAHPARRGLRCPVRSMPPCPPGFGHKLAHR